MDDESKWHPKCYLFRDDILVLEDLTLQGYTHIHERDQFTDDQMKSSLIAIARMHSYSFGLAKKLEKNGETIEERFGGILHETLTTSNPWVKSGMEFTKLLALNHPEYGKLYHDQIKETIFEKMSRMFDLMEPSREYQNVLCHRDLWVSNLMFKQTEHNTSCALIDFQIARLCPPAWDFMLHIYLNTRRTKRDEKLREYQEFYYQNLLSESSKRYGANTITTKLPTFEEFVKSCDHYKLIPIVMCGVYITLTHLPSGYMTALRNNDHERYNKLVSVDRSDLMSVVADDQYYRDYVYEMAGEVIETVIIGK